jgi:hypothetical protein
MTLFTVLWLAICVKTLINLWPAAYNDYLNINSPGPASWNQNVKLFIKYLTIIWEDTVVLAGLMLHDIFTLLVIFLCLVSKLCKLYVADKNKLNLISMQRFQYRASIIITCYLFFWVFMYFGYFVSVPGFEPGGVLIWPFTLMSIHFTWLIYKYPERAKFEVKHSILFLLLMSTVSCIHWNLDPTDTPIIALIEHLINKKAPGWHLNLLLFIVYSLAPAIAITVEIFFSLRLLCIYNSFWHIYISVLYL